MVEYRKLFFTFLRIGLFTVGGGYAMIPVMQKTIVEDYKWIDKKEFLDALSLAQSSPGAISINSSIYIGYRLRGIRGALVSAIGTALPSLIIIMLISMFFFNIREIEYVENAFKGIRAAVVALILVAFLQLLDTAKLKLRGYIVLITGAILLIFFQLNPIIVLLIGGLTGLIYHNIKGEDI